MLDKIGSYNDLSPALRKELETRVRGFGEFVKYKFYIEKDDPEPSGRMVGNKVYPSIFKLTPVAFDIYDKNDADKEGRSPLKRVGAIKGGLDRDGNPNGFLKIAVHSVHRGEVTLDLKTREGQDLAMLAELHPKHDGGMFADPNSPKVFRRVDEIAEAKNRSTARRIRTEALAAAGSFNEIEVRDVAASLPGDFDSNTDIGEVRDAVEAFAESDPESFIKLLNSGTVSYRAVAKRAFDKQVLIYIPVENKVIWNESQKVLAVLPAQQAGALKSHKELFADWLLGAVDGEQTYQTLKTLVNS